MTDRTLLEQAGERRLSPRLEAVNGELRRLLDAALELMRRDPDTIPRVADVVAAAGSSKDAFYRAFASRDEFLSVIVDDGARRLLDYLARRRSTRPDPAARVEAVLDGVLDQAANRTVAATTRAVLSCVPARPRTQGIGITTLETRIADMVAPDLDELGSPEPHADAVTLARAVIGEMQAHLWAGTTPGARERAYLARLVERMSRAG